MSADRGARLVDAEHRQVIPKPAPAAVRREKSKIQNPKSKIQNPGIVLAALTIWLGLLWVIATPPFNAPDEPAHLHAVMQVRVLHILPELHFDFSTNPAGEIVNTPLDPATSAAIAGAGFELPAKLEPNESWQPPLDYLTAGLLTQVIPPDPLWILYASRLISVLFGAGMVYFCWAAVRELAPGAPLWAVATAGAVMLLPQAAAGRAVVANDTAVNCCIMAAFYLWFRGLRQPSYDPWLLRAGLVTGLAIMSSLSAGLLVPGLALVGLFRAWGAGPAWRTRLQRLAQMGLGAVAAVGVICLPWAVRNLVVYGEPTGTADLLRYARAPYPRYDMSAPSIQRDFLRFTWESFWGWFGWRDARLPGQFYQQALWITAFLLALSLVAGLSWLVYRRSQRRPLPAPAWQAALILAGICLAVAASYLQFTLTVAFQAQGRLLFPALLPAALVFTGGLYALTPARLRVIALSVPLLWLAIMNAVGLLVIHTARMLP
jgi:hypothetical protein